MFAGVLPAIMTVLLSGGTGIGFIIAQLDTLGIEPRASRMLSGCDTTTPCAHGICCNRDILRITPISVGPAASVVLSLVVDRSATWTCSY